MARFTSLLSRKQAAQYLHISISSVDRLLREGSIPSVKIGGRVFFSEESLDRWLGALESQPKAMKVEGCHED